VAPAAALGLALVAVAAPAPAAERVTLDGAAGPATVRLADGRAVRLTGVRVPAWDPWPARARAFLAERTGTVAAYHAVARSPDRYGRRRGRVRPVDGGPGLAAALVTRGLVLVTAAPDTARVRALLRRERRARRAGRGLWADDRVATPATVAPGGFRLVRGRVRRVKRLAGRTWLDFGPNWWEAFGVILEAPVRRALAGRGIAPGSLTGRRVRVRGWVTRRNGPALVLPAAGLLERVEETAP